MPFVANAHEIMHRMGERNSLPILANLFDLDAVAAARQL
jgi:hypothetical protein